MIYDKELYNIGLKIRKNNNQEEKKDFTVEQRLVFRYMVDQLREIANKENLGAGAITIRFNKDYLGNSDPGYNEIKELIDEKEFVSFAREYCLFLTDTKYDCDENHNAYYEITWDYEAYFKTLDNEKALEGYQNNTKLLPRNYTMVMDAYELYMSNVYKDTKEGVEGVFDLFYRQVPNGGGYTIMAGLDKVIEYIKELKFTEDDIEYFKRKNYGFSEGFYDFLRNFKFTGDIYAIPDGTPVFPNEPLITVKAPLIEAQLLETTLLAMINGAKEHATAARRIVEATPKNVKIMEFGPRRADGDEAAIDASRYAVMAGVAGTSNVLAAKMMDVKALGTMAHSFVQASDTELEGFTQFATYYPNNATLLIDTYDALRNGIPNAIKTFDYMKEKGFETNNIGIRIDSGDLAYLSKKARKMLDDAGYPNAKICLSNSLTAESIKSLTDQGANFVSLGVGDNISKPAGRMGAVYKLVALIKNGKIIPTIKVSEDLIKTINPDFKDLYRAYDKETGYAIADIMCTKGKDINEDTIEIVSLNDFISCSNINNFRLEKLQKEIFKNGKLVYYDPDIMEKQAYCNEQMETIYPEVKRLLNPHAYYVDGTREYAKLKNEMILAHRRK